MITRSLREGMRKQEGQALVLAALMLLVLSIAVITTVNLGHNVIERVRLQNNTDAAAYSMAAQEARAFNFYAFANRTQVSHYVSAMAVQSVLSMVFAIEGWLIDFFGFVYSSFGACAPPSGLFMAAFCAALAIIPVIGSVVIQVSTQLARLAGQFRRWLANMSRILEPVDEGVGRAIYEFRILQAVFATASQAMFTAALANQVAGSEAILRENDPNTDYGLNSLLTVPFNACLFQRAHHVGSGIGGPGRGAVRFGNPLAALDPRVTADRDPAARAKKSMGQIANATRYAADAEYGGGVAAYITNRSLQNGLLPPFLGSLGGPIQTIISAVTGKKGQTRLLSHEQGSPMRMYENFNDEGEWGGDNGQDTRLNKIRDYRSTPSAPIGAIAQGDMLGSDDPYYLGLPRFSIPGFDFPYDRCGQGTDRGKCWGDPSYDYASSGVVNSTLEPSIWAMNEFQARPRGAPNSGLHIRVVAAQPQQRNNRYFGNPPNTKKKKSSCPFVGDVRNMHRQAGVNVWTVCPMPGGICPCGAGSIPVYSANFQASWDGNHRWNGITRFPHFEPGQYASDCASMGQAASLDTIAGRPPQGTRNTASREFNQPSSWVISNKNRSQLKNPVADPFATHNEPALLNQQGTINFGLGNQTQQLVMDNDDRFGIGPLSYDGMGTIVRAQTYYHRPGNWSEQPNFFNPYWRPRLAPVWQGVYSIPLMNRLANAIPAPFNNFPQKIIVH